MNWLLIVVIALITTNIISGYKQGFMRVVFSLVSWILVLVICYFGAPVVTDLLIEKTDIEVTVQGAIAENLNEAIENSGYAEFEKTLPQEIRDMISGESAQPTSIVDVVALANSVVFLIGSVVMLIIARLIIMVINMVLGLASKLPIIGSLDKILGLAAGAVKGFLVCWVLLAIVAALAMTGANTELIALIYESPILTWLYQNNIILNMLFSTI